MAVEAGEAVPPLGRSERERVFLEFEQALICAAEAFYRFAGVALGPLGKQNKLTGQENVILQQLMFTLPRSVSDLSRFSNRDDISNIQYSLRKLTAAGMIEKVPKHQSRHALSPHRRRPGGDRVSGRGAARIADRPERKHQRHRGAVEIRHQRDVAAHRPLRPGLAGAGRPLLKKGD